MTRNQQIVCLAISILASWPGVAHAAVVVETVPSNITLSGNGSVKFNFADVVNANQLVSVSGGNAGSGEGGNFTVAVNYVGGSTYSLFTGGLSSLEFNLSTLANISFPVGTINGLTFTTSPGNFGGFGEHLFIGAGTTFSFNTISAAVPEPASWALMLTGFGAIGYSLRRRRKALPAAA